MAGIFSIVVTSNSALTGLGAILDRMRSLIPFWRDVFAPAYFAEVQDLFAMEGQPRGASGRFGAGHWAPLSPDYEAWKNRHFPGMPILQRTGKLKASLEWNGNSLGDGGVFVPMPLSVLVGTDVIYGKYHNRGTATMPKREFLPTPDLGRYTGLLRTWLLENQPRDVSGRWMQW